MKPSPDKAPTEKQLARIKKMRDRLGDSRIKAYMARHGMPSDTALLNRRQAQKIIDGMDRYMPRPIISVADPWRYM